MLIERRSPPVGVRGFKSLPPHGLRFSKDDFERFIYKLKFSGLSDKEVKKAETRLTRFIEHCSYHPTYDDIIIYINELKQEFEPETVRKHVLLIKQFLKFIGAGDIADQIKLPKVPKRRKKVIKPDHIKALLAEVNEKIDKEYLRLRLRSAILLSATSGLRAEELYRLRLNDIDIENRTIYVRAEIAKDYEDRVTFFNLEAQEALLEYLNTKPNLDRLFSEKSIQYLFSKLNTKLRMKDMRKFFSQQSDRLGMPTAIKKILMGHVVGYEEFVIPRGSDIDLSHYDFQDEEELKKIYDKYWRDYQL